MKIINYIAFSVDFGERVLCVDIVLCVKKFAFAIFDFIDVILSAVFVLFYHFEIYYSHFFFFSFCLAHIHGYFEVVSWPLSLYSALNYFGCCFCCFLFVFNRKRNGKCWKEEKKKQKIYLFGKITWKRGRASIVKEPSEEEKKRNSKQKQKQKN